MKSWELFMMKSEVLKGRSRYLRLWHDLFAWWHEMSASRVQFFCYVSVCHMCIISVVAVQKQVARFTGTISELVSRSEHLLPCKTLGWAFHDQLHIPSQALISGPLWAWSMYCHERAGGKMGKASYTNRCTTIAEGQFIIICFSGTVKRVLSFDTSCGSMFHFYVCTFQVCFTQTSRPRKCCNKRRKRRCPCTVDAEPGRAKSCGTIPWCVIYARILPNIHVYCLQTYAYMYC